MVQLSSKVTFTCIPEASCTHSRCILHAFWTCPASGKKGRGSYASLVEALSRGFVLAQMRLIYIPDASCVHPRPVLHTFQMHANIILELSYTVKYSIYKSHSLNACAYVHLHSMDFYIELYIRSGQREI